MFSRSEFETVYRENYRPIYLYIRKHVNSQEDAEDLTATAFTLAWKSRDSYDETRCPIRAWLYIIAGNLLKNYYRDSKPRVSIDDEQFPEEMLASSQMESAQALTEMRQILADALHVLDDREKTVIINKYFRDVKNSAIASFLGISEGNVRVIASRALDKMQRYLSGKGITL
ncbi:MAG: sigma-70 family RNA polymerase sigma factor [Lachnospiraceae bacterium]|jgi:RNA polymerase sigma-70 factor (ECF subfamily)|nr:sigma-70 family RNA polymerase sigma factor [Lachnospiraceae bacterium]